MVPDFVELVALFHRSVSEIGIFHECDASQLPAPYRQLLAHEHHMTVTMEEFHGAPLELEVVQQLSGSTSYAREIVLRRASDLRPVQYGIVRLHWEVLPPSARGPIERHEAPLGRILMEQSVLRQVRLAHLWSVEPTQWLRRLLERDSDSLLYGRTALILCNGQPGIELLEIAAL
jgi:hypothetical protein